MYPMCAQNKGHRKSSFSFTKQKSKKKTGQVTVENILKYIGNKPGVELRIVLMRFFAALEMDTSRGKPYELSRMRLYVVRTL